MTKISFDTQDKWFRVPVRLEARVKPRGRTFRVWTCIRWRASYRVTVTHRESLINARTAQPEYNPRNKARAARCCFRRRMAAPRELHCRRAARGATLMTNAIKRARVALTIIAGSRSASTTANRSERSEHYSSANFATARSQNASFVVVVRRLVVEKTTGYTGGSRWRRGKASDKIAYGYG